MVTNVTLREVRDADLELFFGHQLDVEAARIAGVQVRSRETFLAHWARIRPEVTNMLRTIEVDGVVAGNITSWFDRDLGMRLVGYRIDRAFWNRGVTTAAVKQFVTLISRPVRAFVSPGNVASWKVLERAGFTRIAEADRTFTYELR